jgi:hypothetical protein
MMVKHVSRSGAGVGVALGFRGGAFLAGLAVEVTVIFFVAMVSFFQFYF